MILARTFTVYNIIETITTVSLFSGPRINDTGGDDGFVMFAHA